MKYLLKKEGLLCAAVVLSSVFMSGCATIINRTEQSVAINSTPSDAIVVINGNEVGKTPWSGHIPRKDSMQATLKKEGYQPQIISLEGRLSGWFWGNIICGGLLGSTTDAVSGGAYEYSPSSFHVALEPINKKEIQAVESQSKLKRYILANWTDIGAELAGKPAERVDALREIMGYSGKPMADFAKMIKADYMSSKDPDAFAEKMLLISK